MNRRLLTASIATAIFVVCMISCHSVTGSSQFVTSEDTMRYLSNSIETEKNRYLIGEPVELIFTVTNLSDERSVTFLLWGTPMEGMFTSDCLSVTVDGKNVEYKGIMVKRMPPQDDDFITIGPGESVENRVNLADGYPLNSEGLYNIFFKGSYEDLPQSDGIKLIVER